MLLYCGVGEDSWECLDCKEIQPVCPKGDQSWVFIGRTDVEAELQYLGHLMQRTDSFETTLMLGMIEGGRRRQKQRMKWLPCLSLTPGAYSNSCPSSWWCHPAISSSDIPLSSCLQSFPAQGPFQWVSYSHPVARVLPFQLQHQSFQRKFGTDL